MSSRSRLVLLVVSAGVALAMPRVPAWAAKAPRPPSHGGTAVDSLVGTGWDDMDAGRYAVAESLARVALGRAKREPGRDSLDLAGAHNLLGQVLMRQGRVSDPEAQQSAEIALGISQRHLGPDSTLTMSCRTTLANVFRYGEKLDLAAPLFQEAYESDLRRYGPNHVETAGSLENLGTLRLQLGQYDEAESLLLRSAAMYEKAEPNSPDVASVAHNLGVLYFHMGEYEAAESAAVRAVRLREKLLGPDHPMTLSSLGLLAEAAHQVGDFPKAIAINERLIATMRGSPNTDSVIFGYSLNNLGSIREETGDFDRAKALWQEAQAVFLRTQGPESPNVAMTLTNLGNLSYDEDRYAEADSLYRRAAAIDEKAYGRDHPTVADDLDNLALSLDEQRRFAEADSLHRRVIAIRAKTVGEESPQMADALDKRGMALAMQGRYAEATELQRRVLTLRIKTNGPSNPLVARTLHQLAELEWVSGQRDSAMAYSLRAEDVSREHLRLTARTLPERQALEYAAGRVHGTDLAVTAALASRRAQDAGSAWDAVIRSRADILDEMAWRTQQANQVTDSETVQLAKALTASRKQWADLVVRGPGDDEVAKYRAAVSQAERAESDAEEALAVRNDVFRRVRDSERLGLQDVRRALPSGFALLAYVRFITPPARASQWTPNDWTVEGPHLDWPTAYAAFVLSASASQPLVVSLGPAARVDSLVGRWEDEIRKPSTGSPADVGRYRAVAAALRAAIWDPVAAQIGHASDTVVIPDGELNLVSLASLPTGNDGYLVEQGPALHYLSAERDVAARADPTSLGRGLLALGDPDFDSHSESGPANASRASFRGARSACGDFAAVRFAGLTATRTEVEDVAARWSAQSNDATKLLGADASEVRFKHDAPGKRVLHLATHGFFLGEKCEEEADETRGIGKLAVAGSPATKDRNQATENPLLLAGLALAGANRRQDAKPDEEDGILTAEEISALDLRATEWAVLSACETGVGAVQSGEGVMGLRRAFEIAGARTLIMSLWPVEDRSAREWMDRLYEARLSGHASTVDAVRQASLGMLKERRAHGESTHPFYWGAFVAAGDWR